MQSGYDINQLVQEAQTRWLKPVEVLFILQNHENYQITQEAPQKPPSGSLFLFNKRVLRFFRKDGHNWRKKKDGRTVGEAHERLKVGNAEALNCYYAHGEDHPSFQRRSYWMLDPAYEHIVLVHYREINEGKYSSGSIAEVSAGISSTYSPSPSTYTMQNSASVSVSDFRESYTNYSSPGSVEVCSDASVGKGVEYFNQSSEAVYPQVSTNDDMSQALRRLEAQLSLDDDNLKDYTPIDNPALNEDDYSALNGASFNEYSGVSFHSNGLSKQQDAAFGLGTGAVKELYIPSSSSQLCSSTVDLSSMLLDTSLTVPVMADSTCTVPQLQRFTIREMSPEWGFSEDSTKVIIVGTFLCNPGDCAWRCMFGNVEVPVQIIQDGVLCCLAPPHPSGKVSLCITSGNRESCSEIREFEYRDKSNIFARFDKHEGETTRSTEELLLLVKLVEMLISNTSSKEGENNDWGSNLSSKQNSDDDSWGQIIESLLLGGGTTSGTLDWVLEQLLKDKLQQWLASRLLTTSGSSGHCSLSRKEQGIIHMIAGLGYEWALNPILGCGVGINFRDINGWTALHWAAKFGREKMVAALIASGASAGAVTDPSSHDPTGRNPAYIAELNGHKGLAGYLSEVALTSHLSSLTIEENEFSKGSADVEAEIALNSISKESINSAEDQISLKPTLAAVRNAAQAAARIQAAFRAHSFRKRLQREEVFSSVDEYGFTPDDIQGLSRMAFRNVYDHNKAALSIQKNFRSWKGRKDFLTMRQKVVKIQAHVRGYQVRKKYKVICWAVGILDKAVLRWRRKGAGLRGYKREPECINEDEEEEDIAKIFREEKVNVAIDEAVSRVLSMVESPEARQQYNRVLGKYKEVKAQLQDTPSQAPLGTSALQGGASDLDNDDISSFLETLS